MIEIIGIAGIALALTLLVRGVARTIKSRKNQVKLATSGGQDFVYSEVSACSGKTWCDECYLEIAWGVKGKGFGQLLIYKRNGQIHCDNEMMSREFCRAAMRKAADGLCPATPLKNLSSFVGPLPTAAPVPSTVKSVELVDFSGQFEGPISFVAGQFTLLVELNDGEQQKIVVKQDTNQEHFVLSSPCAPQLVREAFDCLALSMQLDDEERSGK